MGILDLMPGSYEPSSDNDIKISHCCVKSLSWTTKHTIVQMLVSICSSGFVRASLHTTLLVQGYVMPHWPALCTMMHKGDLCPWEVLYTLIKFWRYNKASLGELVLLVLARVRQNAKVASFTLLYMLYRQNFMRVYRCTLCTPLRSGDPFSVTL